VFFLVVGVLVATVGCAPDNEFKSPPPAPVTVALPVRADVTNFLEETGITEAVAKVEVRARVRGFLEQVNFEPGAEVQEDDILYAIQQREFIAKRDAALAAVDAEKVELEKAHIEYDRQLRLQADNATSEVEVVSAKAARDAATAAVAVGQAALDQAELDLEYTEVRAPISGRVAKTLVKVGNLVGNGDATHLTTIISYDPIYANFNISERDFLQFIDREDTKKRRASGAPKVKFRLQRASDTGFPFEGTFDYADLAVDQSTGNYMVRGIFPNPDRAIVPGLFVRVRVPIGTIKDALLIPERAVNADQAGRYVLVVNAENVVERRDVVPGFKTGGMQVISKGLNGDDRVIIDGGQRARPGSKVAPTDTTLPALVVDPAISSPDDDRGDESPLEDEGSDDSASDREAAASDSPDASS
jgi:RND family efflux transporter MFP subunit